MTRRLALMFALIFVCLFSSAAAYATSSNDFKPSKSDANIRAIGHRKIANGLNFYSVQHERDLGKQLALQINHSAVLVDDPAITRYVDRIGQTIAQHSDVQMPVTFYIIDSDKIIAFTLPGGYQYIDRGLLLQLKSEAELAAVLAHGIAQTALRSATREATRTDIARIAAISTPVFVPFEWPPGAPPQGIAGTKVTIPLTGLNARRYDELAADYFGLQYLYVAGYNPECYVSLLERISPQSASALPSVFSPSPPLDKQVALMQKEIRDILPKQSGAVVSTPAFTDFQQQLLAWKPVNTHRH